MGTFAIIISLALLMFFAYRGISVLILAPIMAAVAILLSGDMLYLMPQYTETFMSALGGYILKFFPIFLLGALFGQLMVDSGAASSISNWIMQKLGHKRAILTVVLACGVLTYGGVSLFVVAFAIYPIAKSMFQAANIPKRLIPGAIALGSFTFTMTALPGSPSIQNAIPIPFFGTNVFAAPGIGTISGLVMFVLGCLWLQSRANKAHNHGEGYGIDTQESERLEDGVTAQGKMPVLLAFLPLLLVIGVNALFTYLLFPNMDFSAFTELYPKLDPAKQTGLWALVIALVVACLSLILLRLGKWNNLKETVNKGALGSMLPIFNTASEVGYGAVIASLAGFVIIRDMVLNVSSNPLISEAIAMNILAGITGSSSGGMSIALSTLGADYLAMATAAGINPELLHRIAALAAGCLDTLPHSGAVITLLSICGMTHKQSYGHVAMCTVLIPMVSVAVAITLGTLFGSF
ncbi:GntP family permease [Acinetobacter lanii]|uniref:GntP family permease n=1 Tax=Acinetobacter lanii TaxID=2715163 RepID=A0A6G8S704_9GAMM|nr:GntP family permease [Acinetobacter lanii]QIO09894.1 GntP family permease [Acinetobacter lanii]